MYRTRLFFLSFLLISYSVSTICTWSQLLFSFFLGLMWSMFAKWDLMFGESHTPGCYFDGCAQGLACFTLECSPSCILVSISMCQKCLSTMSLLLITNIKFMCFVWAALELKRVCLHLVCVISRHGLGWDSNDTITLSKTPWFHAISVGSISKKMYFSLMIVVTIRTHQHFNSVNVFLTGHLTLNSH